MRVMVIVKATKNSEAGAKPKAEMFAAMGKFNDELAAAGLLVEGAGLKPSSTGARVVFTGEKRSVVRGPFPESNDLITGFWIWNVKSMDEAMEWAKRCPHPHPGEDTNIEIRPFFEMADFADLI